MEAAPGAGLGADVEHGIHAAARGCDIVEAGEVALHLARAERGEARIHAAVVADHVVPASDEALRDGLAEKAAAAGDE